MIQQTSFMQHHTHAEKEYIIEEEVISEGEWQRWQALYAIRRRETFSRILEAQGKYLAPLS
ncbi:MAG: hypothetical protein HY707_03025 [Ignavibacteriae bacterium]|nr:hypothetical protein [Ignavibacteriota bacterium]